MMKKNLIRISEIGHILVTWFLLVTKFLESTNIILSAKKRAYVSLRDSFDHIVLHCDISVNYRDKYCKSIKSNLYICKRMN